MPAGEPTPATDGRILERADAPALVAAMLIALVMLGMFSGMPVHGDAAAYGYRSAVWMAENGLQPVPAG
ncbi:hypothetical protein JW921_07645, partial [Candidatus Fermentibacterales bacterium]|nr:hypothetical protein [Candidatus Fermentibacterales bacterium]